MLTHAHWSPPALRHATAAASDATHSFSFGDTSASSHVGSAADAAHSTPLTFGQHPPRQDTADAELLTHAHWSPPALRHATAAASDATHSFVFAVARLSVHGTSAGWPLHITCSMLGQHAPRQAGMFDAELRMQLHLSPVVCMHLTVTASDFTHSVILMAAVPVSQTWPCVLAGGSAEHTESSTRPQQLPRQFGSDDDARTHSHRSLPARRHAIVSASLAMHSFVLAAASACGHASSLPAAAFLEHSIISMRGQHAPRQSVTAADAERHEHWLLPPLRQSRTGGNLARQSVVFVAAVAASHTPPSSLTAAGCAAGSGLALAPHTDCSTRPQQPPRHPLTDEEALTHAHRSPPPRKHLSVSGSLVVHVSVCATTLDSSHAVSSLLAGAWSAHSAC